MGSREIVPTARDINEAHNAADQKITALLERWEKKWADFNLGSTVLHSTKDRHYADLLRACINELREAIGQSAGDNT